MADRQTDRHMLRKFYSKKTPLGKENSTVYNNEKLYNTHSSMSAVSHFQRRLLY